MNSMFTISRTTSNESLNDDFRIVKPLTNKSVVQLTSNNAEMFQIKNVPQLMNNNVTQYMTNNVQLLMNNNVQKL